MTVFQQKLWGYELTYPKDWMHKKAQDIDAFAAHPESLKPNYKGSRLGHVLVRGEFNSELHPIEELWNQHIAKLSVLLGAKQLGSAPLQIGGGAGFEVEIVLPKKDKKRLWVGILEFNTTILHLMVLHLKENRNWFEPVASKIIASLFFIERASEIETNQAGLPLPPDYVPIDPLSFLSDIRDPENWEAYEGKSDIAALQNFYLRELPVHGWDIIDYDPFPGSEEVNFARLCVQRDGKKITAGILPMGDKNPQGKIAFKYKQST